MIERVPFGYVTALRGSEVQLTLLDTQIGRVVAQRSGTASILELESLFAIRVGPDLVLAKVASVQFLETREAHKAGVGSSEPLGNPIRELIATLLGVLRRAGGDLEFHAGSVVTPPLGAAAVPLAEEELGALLSRKRADGPTVTLGTEIRSGTPVIVGVEELLARHVAVLGSTGQGKSCFTAAALQELVRLARPRIVVLDINGEYEQALRPHLDATQLEVTRIGPEGGWKIPYFALGRSGLARLLLPSEKTQRPALNFALDALRHVQYFADGGGVGLSDERGPVLFDDCRPAGALEALNALNRLRAGEVPEAGDWPPMIALAGLVAESHSTRVGPRGAERNGFEFGNVAPLVTRIRRLVEDRMFAAVVETTGAGRRHAASLDWQREGAALVDRVFGSEASAWKVHIVDLREVAHDLLPFVLGAMLELLAYELFRRGQGGTRPTLLVLEEAHHYLRQIGDDADGARGALAYERLAKEGRKFGVGMWVSTQRPSEISPTVLSQCGTWVAFRIVSEADAKAIAAGAESANRALLAQLPGLPRRQALIFGSAVPFTIRFEASEASPLPKSEDPRFREWAQ